MTLLLTILVKHDRNELTLKFQMQECLEAKSQDFILSGLVTVQFKIAQFTYINTARYYNTRKRYCSVTLKLTKIDASDKFNYSVKVESQILQIPGITYLCADHNQSNAHWQELYNYHGDESSGVIWKFDFKLGLNISAFTSNGLSGLSDDVDLSDFELRGEDGSVRMHKAVLAGFSPVMKTMLSGEWKETSEAAVTIPNTSQKTLQHLKDFMYEQKLPESGLEELAALASCYMMKDLQEHCTRKMLTTLTADNALNLLKFSVEKKMATLFLSILEMIQHGAIQVENVFLFKDPMFFDLNSSEPSDFEIRGVNGTVRMQESILFNFNPIMRVMLSNNWKKVSERAIEMSNATVETLQHLNDYIYEQKLPETGLEDLAALAASFELNDLEKECIQKIISSLTPINVAKMIEFAFNEKVHNLLQAIFKRIQDNKLKVQDIKQRVMLQWPKNV